MSSNNKEERQLKEEELYSTLSSILFQNNNNTNTDTDIDKDLIRYLSSMISESEDLTIRDLASLSKNTTEDTDDNDNALYETIGPFLESSGCGESNCKSRPTKSFLLLLVNNHSRQHY